ncbi:hypothetical protein [Polyangium sp. y55x31]|uniref:hypothetical protein n=1 Tax=Polyangium sp. y55x31 TaxID=3042688 RepID=UPI0024830174|nr:hypothetical protein [Polyangium sp. y55x31]MDI1484438.1 hypothetical protein [Polyangium sp. y55x31]
MRNDLDKACTTCKLRLPATDSVCPRCRAATVPVADALRSLRGRTEKDAWLDAQRTLALYVPAALGLFASVIIDALFLREEVFGTPSFERNAFGVGLGVLAGLSFFGIWCLILALPWVLWAGLVTVTFAVYRHVRETSLPPPLLVPLPVPTPLRPSLRSRATDRLAELSAKLDAWHNGRQKPSLRIPLLVLFGAMVIAEVFAKKPLIELTSLKAFANSAGPLLIMMIPLAIVAKIALMFPLYAANHITERLVAALRRIDAQKAAQIEDEPSVEPLRAGRASARGRISQGQTPALVAPISGKPCLAFRLVGRIDDILLDDGDAVPMTVVNGAESMEIRGERFSIALDKPEAQARSLDAAAAARIATFLAARGIQTQPRFVDLGETCVQEGDEIEAWGTAQQERTAGGGYRDVVRRVLDDGDGLPVLITR